MGAKKSKFISLSDPHAKWRIISDLGSGSYGKVHCVQNKQDSSQAAAKVAKVESKGELVGFNSEINILAGCHHRNITSFISAFYHDQKLWIVIEKCDGGSLADVMNKAQRAMNEPEIQTTAYQMLDALNYLHNKNIYHRDINAANTLLSNDGLIKLADFGVSSMSSKRRHTFIGSPMWMAPEVVKCEKPGNEGYTNKCDIWSLGVTLIETAEMKPPNHDLHPMKAMMKIAAGAPPKLQNPENYSQAFSTFLTLLLVKDPIQRQSAGLLLENKFVAGQNDPGRLKLLCDAAIN